MRLYHCFECGCLTEHLNVQQAAKRAGVSRGTAYRWIHRSLVHSLLHPSGRIFVCAPSLLTPGFLRFPGERAAAVPWSIAAGDASATGPLPTRGWAGRRDEDPVPLQPPV